jgi:hypothetical protein
MYNLKFNIMRTFKIGEYCYGGIVKSDKKDGLFNIQILDWNTKSVLVESKGMSSDDAYDFLMDYTTHYYSEKIINETK